MRRWRALSTPAWAGIVGVLAVLLGGGLFVLAKVLDRGVIEDEGCRIGPSVGRIALSPGQRSFLTVPLPRARSTPVRIEAVRANGSFPREQVVFGSAPDEDLAGLKIGRRGRRPSGSKAIGAARLTSFESDRFRDPNAKRDRSAWSLVVGVEAVERGIFHISSLDVTYRSGERASSCRHDLSVVVAVGEQAPDAGRLTPVYVGVGYGHSLHTHCGILHTEFGGLRWTADPPLHDGSFNPPPLWSNPSEVGTMRLIAPDVALFETRDKLEARFRPRSPEDPPIRPCD